jgi:predicted DNA-binding transcriptional regulator YafY
MQISRLFQIIYVLLEKNFITAKELADYFEVSVRTIYRDIDALCQAGIPIYSTQGKGGGFALVDKFVLDKSLISELEQNKILLALQSLSVAGYPELDDVLSKLSRIFQKSNTNWIEVDFSKWGSNRNRKEVFSLVKSSILEQKVIIFSYFSVNGEKSERRVEPFKLLFKDKSWYLQGYCLHKMACRTFKINRMMNISITEEVCSHNNSKEIPLESVSTVSMNQIQLKLKISYDGSYRVYDDFAEENITQNKDSSYTIIVSLPEGEWLYNYLFSFGTTLEVIEPQSVRNEITNRLNNMTNKYNSKT